MRTKLGTNENGFHNIMQKQLQKVQRCADFMKEQLEEVHTTAAIVNQLLEQAHKNDNSQEWHKNLNEGDF